MTQKLKTAVLLTGAAARISQEVAMLDMLMDPKRCGLKLSQDDTLIAGFSSGSLNLAAINACFSTGSQLGWDTYYKQTVLFPLRNKDVYKIKFPPFDTTPLRNTIQTFVDKMNCKKVGDLAFYSYILACSKEENKTLWACSQNPGDEYLNITDTFMASTAIPILFPPQEISSEAGQPREFPDGYFVDGGTLGTFDGFDSYLGQYVRQNEPFENMYIISPMRQTAKAEREGIMMMLKDQKMEGLDLLGGKLEQIIEWIAKFLEKISMNTFMTFLKALNAWTYNGQKMAKNIYISIPQMDKNFFIIDFDLEKKQYDAVTDWVGANPDKLAIPIDEFLKMNEGLMVEEQ
ncbi:MAG: patatin-like phospholipase family protein [Bacteroidales bacterium]|nr:patatin-like phospholipase family protein [Bacteroidales bacterium]